MWVLEQEGDEQDLREIFGKNKFSYYLQNPKGGWRVGRKLCSVWKDDIVSGSSGFACMILNILLQL